MLKSDYFRIEIGVSPHGSWKKNRLKSDYFRIEIPSSLLGMFRGCLLKSDYFRIEIVDIDEPEQEEL